jgi:phosphoglycolate phosphatase-like HAD superfamily hydrolase
LNVESSTLALFDIDGTLLDLHGAGRRAFALALEDTFGWADEIEYIQFAGATDLDVLDQVFRRHDRSMTREDAERFFAAMPKRLRETSAFAEVTVYPGAVELVATLSEHPNVTIGLVTGNIESCARIKLEKAGLHGHFTLGAFGHEHGDRREIARLARTRAHATLPPGASFARTFLIGDTPSDITAAHHIGAISIAVTTGHYTRPQLINAGAHHVLDTLALAHSIIL